MKLADIEAKRDEFTKWLEPWILKKDREYRELAETEVSKRSRPPRTAGGKNRAQIASWSWFWGDALWCQDIHVEALAEFIGIDFAQDTELMDECGELAEDCFNKVLKAAVPEAYWRHIAIEIGDEPQTDEQRKWVADQQEG